MSIRVMAEMWNADLNPNLSGGLLLLALALADWCNDDGECYPSIAQLAKKTRVSEATVRNWLATLEESGVIAVLPNSGRASKVGKTNKYLFIEYREKNNLPTSPTRFYTRKKSPRFATIEGGKRFEGGKPVDPVGGKPVDPLGGKNAYPITSLDTSLDTSNKNIDVAKATSLGVFSDDAEERTQPLSEGKQNPAPTEGKPKKPRPSKPKTSAPDPSAQAIVGIIQAWWATRDQSSAVYKNMKPFGNTTMRAQAKALYDKGVTPDDAVTMAERLRTKAPNRLLYFIGFVAAIEEAQKARTLPSQVEAARNEEESHNVPQPVTNADALDAWGERAIAFYSQHMNAALVAPQHQYSLPAVRASMLFLHAKQNGLPIFEEPRPTV